MQSSMMQSSSDLTKVILKSILSRVTEVSGKVLPVVNEVTGLDFTQRLKIMREKANGTNKLTFEQIMNTFVELISNKDKSALERQDVKIIFASYKTLLPKLVDSDGKIDITRFFCSFAMFQKNDFISKMQLIFNTIDENGDGYLSREEVTKFFTIVLADTFLLLKEAANNPVGVSISAEASNAIINQLPELEKVFDHSKIQRLVDGAFHAVTNSDNKISRDQWAKWIQTNDYKEQWGTISLLFDTN